MQRQNSIWTADDDLLALATTTVTLAPSQLKAANRIMAAASSQRVCLLQAGQGIGKTTILRWLQARLGGVFIAARQFTSSLARRRPAPAAILFVDDLQLVTPASEIGVAFNAFPHNQWILSSTDKPLVTSWGRAVAYTLKQLTPEDYSRICHRYLGDAADRLDMTAIHRAAPALNGYQLKHACLWLGLRYAAPSTEAFLECL